MTRMSFIALVLGVVVLAGCESGTAMRMDLPAAQSTVAAVSVDELAAAGGGRIGMGHLGTGISLLFPMDRALDNTWMADINFNFNVTPNISVELGAGWADPDAEDPGFSGDLQMIPLSVGAQYGDRFGDAGRWYAGLGLGWIINDFNGTVTADDALLIHLMGGVDIPINNLTSLDIELRYQMANTDLSSGDTLDLDAFVFRVNFVWLF
ncbi:MAG: outer membrane beta-barrel protein [Planctomycetes bacterium]|nr:outer membrane beta-barrel protein [Planctomycetota bacterium]